MFTWLSLCPKEKLGKERMLNMADLFGITKDGKTAHLYKLHSQKGIEAYVTDFGATLVKLLVPDRKGEQKDVVLGYEDVAGYEAGACFFGASVGRVANRIAQGSFELDGQIWNLTKNDNGVNTLHSGRDFTSQRIWSVEDYSGQEIVFLLHSPDGDQGYPGTVDIRVTYTLTEDGGLKIHYYGVPDQDTLLNFTNHSYFNLDGHDSGSVLMQTVEICADAYTRTDARSIPTGEIVPVAGTPMDFRQEISIGARIDEPYEALIYGGGYDHNYVLNGKGFRCVAQMYSKNSGIRMQVETDLPGMQFYTANFVEKERGKEGVLYGKRQGACFETQYFPDAIHHENFPSPIVKAGEVYETTTIYRFLK